MAARLFALVVIGLVVCFLAGYLYAYFRVEGVVAELRGRLSQTEGELSRLGSNHSVLVGAYYYVWYGLPADSHWNSNSCTVTRDRPVLGYYSSLNSSVVRWQVSEAEAAGLSFFIVSWWGPPGSNADDDEINRAALNFFSVLASMHTRFKAAIMIDAYNDSLGYSGYLYDYEYVYQNFVVPYNSSYLYFEGKPLLVVFNTPDPMSLHPPLTDLFTLETVGNIPNPVDWLLWGAGNVTHPARGVVTVGGGVNLSPTISPDGYVSVTPRFDDSLLYRSGCRLGALVLDQNLTLHLYQEQWGYVLEHRSQVSLVVVYSWNEYFERSFIEPAYSYTDPALSPYYLLNLTANYTRQLNS